MTGIPKCNNTKTKCISCKDGKCLEYDTNCRYKEELITQTLHLNEIFEWRLKDGTLFYMFLYCDGTNGYLCAHREITRADAEKALKKIMDEKQNEIF